MPIHDAIYVMKPNLLRFTIILCIAVCIYISIAFTTALLKTTMVCRQENGIYVSLVRSVLEDGDLNIVNQVPPEQRWLVSPTFNVPDNREEGYFALWLPFFAYGQFLPQLDLGARPWGSPVNHYDVAQILATLFFSLIGLIWSLWIMKLYMGKKWAWISVTLLTLGTPVLWYVFFEPFGTDVLSGFTITASIFLYLLLLKNESTSYRYWTLLGAFLAVASAIKVYGAFYLAGITAQVILRWYFEGRKSRHAREAIYLLVGVATVFSLHFANHYIKFGTLASQYWELQRYFAMFTSVKWSPFYIYFGPNGGAFVSPIYFVASIAGAWWLYTYCRTKEFSWKKAVLSVRALLFVVPLIVFVLTSLEMIDSTFGTARRFAAQQIAFLLALQFLFQKASGLRKRVAFAVTGVATFWGFLMLFRFSANKDNWGEYYFGHDFEWPATIERTFTGIVDALINLPGVALELVGWLPACVVCASILFVLWKTSEKPLKPSVPIFFIAVLIYVVGSSSNILINARNVEKLKSENFFATTVVAAGMTAFIYDDLTSVLPNFKRLGKVRRNPRMTKDAIRIEKTILNDIVDNILVDPIGFKDDAAKGIVRPSYFEADRR